MGDDHQATGHEVRFRGVERLYGKGSLQRLGSAHVAVVGLGGVGSWIVESLARSGLGALTLIDLDEVCLTNVNRQLPAMDGAIGRFKAEVLAERVKAIHPGCRVEPVIEFFTESTADRLLGLGYDVVVDAIDVIANKCRLIAGCRARGIPVVACGAAGGRRDPTCLRRADLAEATHDRLLAEVRRRLRREHGFPGSGAPMGVPCVFSTEIPVVPDRDRDQAQACEAGGGTEGGVWVDGGASRRLGCETGLGSAAHVTGAFGLVAAAGTVELILTGRTLPGSGIAR